MVDFVQVESKRANKMWKIKLDRSTATTCECVYVYSNNERRGQDERKSSNEIFHVPLTGNVEGSS